MLLVAMASAVAVLTTPAHAESPMVEECRGTETIKIGNLPPKSVPYHLIFKADISEGTYCYGPCTKDQTYKISDPKSSPMKLADLDKGRQVRHMTFDRVSSKLADYQVFNSGLGVITRNAAAICKPAKL